MSRSLDTLLAASAPAIWGSTYIVTTQMLPAGYPLTDAVLRALPAGLLLLAITRELPERAWLGRIAILGALNFAIFWAALFVAAYRLPAVSRRRSAQCSRSSSCFSPASRLGRRSVPGDFSRRWPGSAVWPC